ncbi:RagB/SusD family nutrient uptake outer membrane protein [Marinoscillum furvescens]|nr:RagB/SusD family nutrient uptake outer membrane protein [Marinoscillum furvescens]
MKLRIYLLGIVAMLMTGCQDFLDEELSSVTTAATLETTSDVNSALAGVYSGLLGQRPGGYYGRLFYYLQDIPTDQIRATNFPGPLDSFEGDANNNIIRGTYTDIYSMIFRANNLLANLEGDFEEDFINQVEGELRFLRALGYYDLTSLYGDVVLTISPDFRQADAPPLTAIAEIEQFILDEMEIAISLLSVEAPDARPGAITRGAALMLKLKTHLRRKEWQDVVTTAERIEALDRYALEPDFMTLWQLGQPFNSEVIFNVMATGTPFGRGSIGELSSGSCDMAVYMYDFQTDWRGFGGVWHLERDFFFSYDSADARWSEGCRQFWLSSLAANLGDTVKSPGPDGKNVIRYISGTDTVRYPGPGASGSDRLYFSNKYPHPDANSEDVYLNTDIFHNNNLPVFRYADVLLAWAEALNELNGPSPDVFEKINRVRHRAGLGDIQGELPTADQAAIRSAILQERGWEFGLEGKRREDLIRHDKFIEFVTASFGYSSRAGDQPLTQEQLLFPIPFTELELNPQWGK